MSEYMRRRTEKVAFLLSARTYYSDLNCHSNVVAMLVLFAWEWSETRRDVSASSMKRWGTTNSILTAAFTHGKIRHLGGKDAPETPLHYDVTDYVQVKSLRISFSCDMCPRREEKGA